MAEKVEIDIPGIGKVEAKNAATEKTLKDILDVMKSMKGGAGKGGGKGATGPGTAATGANTAAQQTAAKGAGKLTKTFLGLTQTGAKLMGSTAFAASKLMSFGASATNAIERLSNVGDSLTAAAGTMDMIPIVGGPLSQIFGAVAGAVEKSTGAFQSAAKSGATFGGSINSFAASASAAGMTMEKFGNLIRQNADSMMVLGGTTADGAKRFADLAKQMRSSQVGTELYNLGYSTEEVNAGMASYIKQMGNTGKLQGKSTAEIAAASGKYLKELDGLAQITGQTREEKMKEQEALQKDAQFRAATANLDADQKEMLQNFITSFPKEQQAAVKDMIATGSITSEAASKMQTQMGGTAQQIMQYGQILKQGGKLSKTQLDGTYRNAVLEAKARSKTAEFQTIGSYAYGEFGDAILGVAELAARDADGKKKALTEQEKAAQGAAAVQEKAKQRLAEVSNSFTMVLANSGLLDKLMKSFEMLSSFVSNVVVPVFNVVSAVVGMAIDAISMLITPVMSVVSSLVDYLQPAFYTIGDFIEDNMVPILAGVGTVIGVTVIPALVAMAASFIANAASMVVAALAFVAPFIPLAAVVGAAVYLFKKLGGDLTVVGNAFKWVAMTFKEVFLKIKEGFFSLLNKIPGMRGDFDEDLKEIAKEQEELGKNKEKLEKETAQRMADNRKKNEEEDEKKAKEREKRDAALADKKHKKEVGAIDDKVKREKAAAEASEPKKDYENQENLLRNELSQQRGKEFAEYTKAKDKPATSSSSETARKEMETKAEEKKKAEEASQKENESKKNKGAEEGGKPSSPSTQESAETLLASLNSKMDQLIKINKTTSDLNEKQLSVQQSMSGDLYVAGA